MFGKVNLKLIPKKGKRYKTHAHWKAAIRLAFLNGESVGKDCTCNEIKFQMNFKPLHTLEWFRWAAGYGDKGNGTYTLLPKSSKRQKEIRRAYKEVKDAWIKGFLSVCEDVDRYID